MSLEAAAASSERRALPSIWSWNLIETQWDSNIWYILWMVAKSESPVENGGKHPISSKVSIIQGCAGFLPSTVGIRILKLWSYYHEVSIGVSSKHWYFWMNCSASISSRGHYGSRNATNCGKNRCQSSERILDEYVYKYNADCKRSAGCNYPYLWVSSEKHECPSKWLGWIAQSQFPMIVSQSPFPWL